MNAKIKIANPMSKALFTHSGHAAQAVAIDTRPKSIARRTVYRRTEKHRGRRFDD